MRATLLLLLVLLVLLVLLSGCASTEGPSEELLEAAGYVATLQTGTVSELRDLRGTGPFETYDVAPSAMLPILERAFRRAGAEDEPPYVHVYVSARYGEVLAKEFGEPHKGYADPFRSAALATVHPVRGAAERCRVEIHSMDRGPFHRGSVAWRPSLPGWIAAAWRDRPPRKIDP